MGNILYLTVLYISVLKTYAIVNVIDIFSEEVIKSFYDTSALFGGSIDAKGIKGYLKYLEPDSNDKCNEYGPAPPWVDGSSVWIALMERRGCEFVSMVHAAQKMHYDAVIVFNSKMMGNDVVVMTASGGAGSTVTIPSVFVAYDSGISLKSYIVGNRSRYLVQIKHGWDNEDSSEKSSSHFILYGNALLLIPAVIILFCCVAKHKFFGHTRGRRLSENTRPIGRITSSSSLKINVDSNWKNCKENQIRKAKFTESHRYETCPVCLEDFVEKDKVWILPCEHEFHIGCVKPWLTKKQTSCPVCKRMSISLTVKAV